MDMHKKCMYPHSSPYKLLFRAQNFHAFDKKKWIQAVPNSRKFKMIGIWTEEKRKIDNWKVNEILLFDRRTPGKWKMTNNLKESWSTNEQKLPRVTMTRIWQKEWAKPEMIKIWRKNEKYITNTLVQSKSDRITIEIRPSHQNIPKMEIRTNRSKTQ